MEQTPTLAEEIDAFIAQHAMSPITFGRKALNDPHFVRDLKNGRDLKLSTVDRVRAFIAHYSPADAQVAA